MATSNYLDRNVDEDRIEADADTAAVQQVIALSPENSAAIHIFWPACHNVICGLARPRKF